MTSRLVPIDIGVSGLGKNMTDVAEFELYGALAAPRLLLNRSIVSDFGVGAAFEL